MFCLKYDGKEEARPAPNLKHPNYWPPSALTRELHRAKLLRKHFVGLAHNLNHKLMKIRIFSIVNNDLPPIIIQGHSPLPQNVNINERK